MCRDLVSLPLASVPPSDAAVPVLQAAVSLCPAPRTRRRESEQVGPSGDLRQGNTGPPAPSPSRPHSAPAETQQAACPPAIELTDPSNSIVVRNCRIKSFCLMFTI